MATTESASAISSDPASRPASGRQISRSGGAPTEARAARITSTVARALRWARGLGLKTAALRVFSIGRALQMMPGAGAVAGLATAITPSGLAILSRPSAGSDSTTPTVRAPCRSCRMPSTRLRWRAYRSSASPRRVSR